MHKAMGGIVGEDPVLRAVLARAALVAPTAMPVLVTGESGTGKELVARGLHELGPRPDGPFVAVNCGALPRELAESELFGHERGAFTGAAARRAGWFEEASGGTLVLDEVGELPLDMQPKLLRVLETGRLRRVGGAGEIGVRVRIVAMTLRDLAGDVHRRNFRDDLYHRLAGFCLRLPPLRERRADIPLLAAHFLREVTAELGERQLDASAMAALTAAPFRLGESDVAPVTALAPVSGDPPLPDGAIRIAGRTFDEIEREVFAWALRCNAGSRRRAARALSVARSTFCDKVKRYCL